MAQAQTKEQGLLAKKLRKYSAKYVKISKASSRYARRLVKKYIGDRIMIYCRQNSTLPISRLEYAGSVYERLKTEAADEVDIMVVLKTTKSEVKVQDSEVPGYALLVPKANSNLRKYASCDGKYIDPERLRNGWFFSLVDQAVRHFRDRSPYSDIDMVARAHGPAVQVDIVEKATGENLLSVDLVPCFFIRPDSFYVAKPYTGCRSVSSSDLLWRQSFSLKEKSIVKKMDKDHGRRHELLRIVKTMVNREPTSLGRLESYHLKTAFMHYIKEKPYNWTSRNSLGEHFVKYLEKLQRFLENGNLPHYWLDKVNILEGVDVVVLGNMACRLKSILNSDAERDQILKTNEEPT